MGRDGGSRNGKPRPSGGQKSQKPPARTPRNPKTTPPAVEPPAPPAPERFVLGAIPGATPGGWIDTWRERMPHTPLELEPISVADQRARLWDGGIDAALVRLPIDREGLSVISLYDEVPVVVCSADSHLTAVDELAREDLAGEILIVPRDDVLGIRVPQAIAPAFDAPEDTAQAIATVAAGVGIVIVPMSLARLHRRKDVAWRILRDAPMSTVALAWPSEHTNAAVEAFIGIVRGRTANSSRA